MNLKSVPVNRRLLSNYTSVKIGGRACDFFYISNHDELKFVYEKYMGKFYLLGGGSNLLVTDSQLSRPVVKFKGGFDEIKIDKTTVYAGAGVLFSSLLKICVKEELGGLENLAGIPGTIGGMVVMNASAFKREISDLITEVHIFDLKKKVRIFPIKQIKFGYRESSLEKEIILGARFSLRSDRFVRERMNDFLRDRIARQDYEYPSFGSVFRNPPGFSAGQLIDSCGLKGLRCNGAQISPRHANFIINIGNATCKDVEYLIEAARVAVKAKYHINLVQEVIKWI
jgi:UDP-N-acetylmuramate dehydrogenase